MRDSAKFSTGPYTIAVILQNIECFKRLGLHIEINKKLSLKINEFRFL